MDREYIMEAQLKRGEDAERLLADPLLTHALDSIERRIVDSLKAIKTDDIDGRDALWRDLRALERLRHDLKNYIRTGKEAKKGLMQLFRGN